MPVKEGTGKKCYWKFWGSLNGATIAYLGSQAPLLGYSVLITKELRMDTNRSLRTKNRLITRPGHDLLESTRKSLGQASCDSQSCLGGKKRRRKEAIDVWEGAAGEASITRCPHGREGGLKKSEEGQIKKYKRILGLWTASEKGGREEKRNLEKQETHSCS